MSRASRLLSAGLTTFAFGGTAVAQDAPAGDGTEPAVTEPVSAPEPVTAPGPTATPAHEEVKPKDEVAPAAPFTITGFINTTYNFNFNNPKNGSNPFWAYNSQHNSLLLNAAHLVMAGTVAEGLTWTVEIDAGADAQANTYANIVGTDPMGAPVTSRETIDVQEAYGVYTKGKFGVKVGKFVTYNGIEVIESPLNPTISRGFLFGLAEPFYHTGGVVIFQATPEVDVHVGVVQGWDVLVDSNRGKMGVFKVGLTPNDKLAVAISGYVGPDLPGNNSDARFSVDVTGVIKPNPKAHIWFQGNFGKESGTDAPKWYGAGVQPVFHLSDKLSLGARAEFFKDDGGARTGGDRQLVNISLAPSYTFVKGFTMRAEARVDISDQEDYQDGDGGGKKNQVAALVDATYSF